MDFDTANTLLVSLRVRLSNALNESNAKNRLTLIDEADSVMLAAIQVVRMVATNKDQEITNIFHVQSEIAKLYSDIRNVG